MTATRQDMVIGQNDTHRFVVNVLGGPASIEGYTGEMHIREFKASDVPLAVVAPQHIVVNHLTKQVVVTIPSSVTATYDWTHGVYDLYIVGPGPTYDRWRLVEGNVRLSRSVTRED